MGTTAGTLLVTHLRAQVAALAAAESDVVAGGPEGVHDARVAIRRVRAALSEMPRLVDDDEVGDLPERLRGLGRVLGEPRDLEVLLARIDAAGDDAVRRRAHATLDARLDRARADAVAHLGTPEHARLRADLRALVAHPPLTRRTRRRWDAELPRGTRRAARRVDRRVRDAARADVGDLDDALHRVRRAARRARYAAEIVARGSGEVAREAVASARRFEHVQEVLGRQHDGVVLRQALAPLRAAAAEAGEDPAPYDDLAQTDLDRATLSLAALVLSP
ncbi:CHAD domain-containing protein [Xylanimonas allomyrinae]|uniref:CHAD domain-containing protein n=1 Tax=Xylanimonas allomyrinae TaxID=2509459 RepID=A0A4P6EN00_9MICO|nr:CHAD domain-containing protein [Xylanimonas allomyrinae]QAY64062.1 CHAD domain-containing protein [Xylanimonas allomyrinae]